MQIERNQDLLELLRCSLFSAKIMQNLQTTNIFLIFLPCTKKLHRFTTMKQQKSDNINKK